jgi:hypothetical protein
MGQAGGRQAKCKISLPFPVDGGPWPRDQWVTWPKILRESAIYLARVRCSTDLKSGTQTPYQHFRTLVQRYWRIAIWGSSTNASYVPTLQAHLNWIQSKQTFRSLNKVYFSHNKPKITLPILRLFNIAASSTWFLKYRKRSGHDHEKWVTTLQLRVTSLHCHYCWWTTP